MNDQVIKGAIIGLAAGGLTSAVIAINKTVLQTLWWFNRSAVELRLAPIPVDYRIGQAKKTTTITESETLSIPHHV